MTNANGSAVRRENLRRRVAGRNAGTPNKSGNALVEAILSAAEQIGEDCRQERSGRLFDANSD